MSNVNNKPRFMYAVAAALGLGFSITEIVLLSLSTERTLSGFFLLASIPLALGSLPPAIKPDGVLRIKPNAYHIQLTTVTNMLAALAFATILLLLCIYIGLELAGQAKSSAEPLPLGPGEETPRFRYKATPAVVELAIYGAASAVGLGASVAPAAVEWRRNNPAKMK